MAGRQIRLLIATALALTALSLGGCFKAGTTATGGQSGSQVATPQTSVEPTASVSTAATGPITTPESGSELRKQLLDAARTRLGVTSQFYVYQLYVQGDTAIGDLDPVAAKNGRVFVTWERRDGAWSAIGSSQFGAADANAATMARSLPNFSAELIAKIDWTKPKPASASTKKAVPTISESKAIASLKVAADGWSNTAMSGAGKPYKVTLVKVALDAKGVWWGHIVTQPTKDATNSYEPLNFWAKYEAGSWSGSPQDPEPPAPSTFFPASVIPKLGL